MLCSDWVLGCVHHGIGSSSSSSESRGGNLPSPRGRGDIPLTQFCFFGGFPLAFPFADQGFPLFRCAFRSEWFFTFRSTFRSVWRGVSVAFHPFHDMSETVVICRESGIVESFPSVGVVHVVTPQSLVLQVVDNFDVGGGELGEGGHDVGQRRPARLRFVPASRYMVKASKALAVSCGLAFPGLWGGHLGPLST